MAIPKRIIHVYSVSAGGSEELPLASRAAVAGVTLLHPDFEHLLFRRNDIAAFFAQHYPEYLYVFNSFPLPIQRFDFFRYLVIYHLGGFYLDLDVYLARSLEPLLACDCVFPFEELTIYDLLRTRYGVDWELANYAFGAAAHHPFLGRIIENCVLGAKTGRRTDEMLRGIPRPFRSQFVAPATTGPGLVSRTLAEDSDLAKSVTILFPPDVREARDWHSFGEFGVHLMSGSWRARDGWVRSHVARLWENRRRGALMCESIKLGPRRLGPWQNHTSGVAE